VFTYLISFDACACGLQRQSLAASQTAAVIQAHKVDVTAVRQHELPFAMNASKVVQKGAFGVSIDAATGFLQQLVLAVAS